MGKLKPDIAAKGAEAYLVGPYERFDQINEMYKRPKWDESVRRLGEWKNMVPEESKPGYTAVDLAYRHAGWYVHTGAFLPPFTEEHCGLYSWESNRWGDGQKMPEQKYKVDDPVKMARIVKKVAKFYGASMVGITKLDERWLYSKYVKTRKPVEIPEECQWVIVMAHAMDYDYFRYSPTHIEGAATAKGYSDMAYVSALLSQFIRGLGYKALPCGNDTALSIPFAIDAGLGELGRNGLLITPEFGPRQRLSKVFTNMPLAMDKPLEFGVWDFCRSCGKCAANCPGRAIVPGEPSSEIHNISNSKNVYRWAVDGEKCLNFWVTNNANCGSCIRVCPFNKAPGVIHDAARWFVKNTPWANPLMVKVDDLLGYGKRAKADRFWD